MIPREVKALIDRQDEERTLNNLIAYERPNANNFVYGLLNYTHPYFSIPVLSQKIKVVQLDNSDLIEIGYSANDPGIAYNTLEILNEEFVKQYRELRYGETNNVIEFFGGKHVNWINYGSSYWANMFVMVVYIVWNALPFKILVLLGGLQSINKQYYDAAKVDGTPRRRVFTHITVPLLSPMLAYVIITGFIGGFKEYTSIVGIFGETMGPPDDGGRLNTMVGFIYDALETNSQGRASAAALILFAIILVVTLINNWVSKKRVHY
jgi:ABC-type molybdate transport system permease subunit